MMLELKKTFLYPKNAKNNVYEALCVSPGIILILQLFQQQKLMKYILNRIAQNKLSNDIGT